MESAHNEATAFAIGYDLLEHGADADVPEAGATGDDEMLYANQGDNELLERRRAAEQAAARFRHAGLAKTTRAARPSSAKISPNYPTGAPSATWPWTMNAV